MLQSPNRSSLHSSDPLRVDYSSPVIKAYPDLLARVAKARELDISAPVCDLGVLFKDMQVDAKVSGKSPSVMMVAKIKGGPHFSRYLERLSDRDDVHIKIGFISKQDNSLDYERAVYKYLMVLLYEMRTPGVMQYVTSFKCDDFMEYLRSSAHPSDKKVLEVMRKKVGSAFDTRVAYFTVTESGKGCSFGELPTKIIKTDPSFTLKNFVELIFQVMYTLREFKSLRVRHNDLHFNNIWVEKKEVRLKRLSTGQSPDRSPSNHPSDRYQIYFVNDEEYYILDSTYTSKIMDFDTSAIVGSDYENGKLKELCPDVGLCSNYNPEFDIHTFAYHLDAYISHFPKEMSRKGREIAHMLCPNREYLGSDCCNYPGRMCHKVPEEPPESVLEYEGEGEVKCDACLYEGSIEGCQACEHLKNITTNLVCDNSFRPPKGDVLSFEEQIDRGVYTGLTKFKLPSFDPKYLPIPPCGVEDPGATDVGIPKEIFLTRVYFSIACTLSPIDMARKLTTLYDTGKMISIDFDLAYKSTEVPLANPINVVSIESFNRTIIDIDDRYRKSIRDVYDKQREMEALSHYLKKMILYLEDPDVNAFMITNRERGGRGYDIARKFIKRLNADKNYRKYYDRFKGLLEDISSDED